MDIPFARPSIGIEEELAVIKVLRSGWLTTGKESISLEKEFVVKSYKRVNSSQK